MQFHEKVAKSHKILFDDTYILSFNYTERTFGNVFLPVKRKYTLQFSKISVSKENRKVHLKDKWKIIWSSCSGNLKFKFKDYLFVLFMLFYCSFQIHILFILCHFLMPLLHLLLLLQQTSDLFPYYVVTVISKIPNSIS